MGGMGGMGERHPSKLVPTYSRKFNLRGGGVKTGAHGRHTSGIECPSGYNDCWPGTELVLTYLGVP